MKRVRITVVGFLLGLLSHCQNRFMIDDKQFCGGLVRSLERGNITVVTIVIQKDHTLFSFEH